MSKSSHIIFSKSCFPPARLLTVSGRKCVGGSWEDIDVVALEIGFLVLKSSLLRMPFKAGMVQGKVQFLPCMGNEDSPSERQAVTEELTTTPSNAQNSVPLK